MDLNANINAQTLEQCLKSVSKIGKTDLINICTGQTNTILWGSLGWVVFIFLTLLGMVFIGIFLKMIFDF